MTRAAPEALRPHPAPLRMVIYDRDGGLIDGDPVAIAELGAVPVASLRRLPSLFGAML